MADVSTRRGPDPVRVRFGSGSAGEVAPVVVAAGGGDGWTIDGAPVGIEVLASGLPRVRLATPSGPRTAIVSPLPRADAVAAGVQRVEVVVDGWRFEIDVELEARARLRERATKAGGAASGGGPLELRAIIPGRVVSVDVAAGDTVEAGGRLLVIEAMKMQNELRAPRAGTVAKVAVGSGQTVERGDLLLVVE